LTAMTSGTDCNAYKLSGEVIKKDKYVLVGTLGQNDLQGGWEHTWHNTNTKSIKSLVHVVSQLKLQQQQQMEVIMNGICFPSVTANVDFKYPRHACRLKLDLVSKEISMSWNQKINHRWTIGGKMVKSFDSLKTRLEFGTRFNFDKLNVKKKK